MDSSQIQELFKSFIKKQSDTLISKSNDYANTDVLSNFRQTAYITGLKSEQIALSLIAIKVARLGNLFNGKTPNNESIKDSVLDLCNYGFLLHCILEESL